ncbi:MAG TPA: beta-1,6-N-acetylglucosaminyltransferase [Flavisolibacter sp.]
MIKKAYIILAHKNPMQLQRLVGALSDGCSHFFVHIDSRTGISPFRIFLHSPKHISILPGIKTEWGGFGLVKAALNGLEAVFRSEEKFDHIILLSGQDYPIKSNKQIDDFLERHKGKNFLEHFPLPSPAKWSPGGGLYRVNKYFFGLKTCQRYAAKSANFLGRLLPCMRRKTYDHMEAFAGSMWWIINSYAAQYIINFVAMNPGYVRFHRFTFAPDELFFHMILLNSKDDRIRSSIVNNDLHFIRWKDIKASHPETIKKEDLGDLLRSEALFARKFDATADAEILDLIDTHCRAANPVHTKEAVE